MKYQYTYDVKEFGNRLRAIRKKMDIHRNN